MEHLKLYIKYGITPHHLYKFYLSISKYPLYHHPPFGICPAVVGVSVPFADADRGRATSSALTSESLRRPSLGLSRSLGRSESISFTSCWQMARNKEKQAVSGKRRAAIDRLFGRREPGRTTLPLNSFEIRWRSGVSETLIVHIVSKFRLPDLRWKQTQNNSSKHCSKFSQKQLGLARFSRQGLDGRR